ncbi:Plasma membrane low glucose sensor [Pichia californica]|uniref:Plasma membrane low glucose sensor n=1 Tax=Pichia californica TaxID=460514 RepID=A0A9P7BCY1_9ASCO|nr:Plasma membrane low glucose sensor [[Candida] californica]KAG0687467.1 Plasma membrane low glucose sensor [[Candida] californica]
MNDYTQEHIRRGPKINVPNSTIPLSNGSCDIDVVSSRNSVTAYIPTNNLKDLEKTGAEDGSGLGKSLSRENVDKLAEKPIKRRNKVSKLLETAIKGDREKQIRETRLRKKKKSKATFMAVYVGVLTAIGGFLYGYDTGIINGVLEMEFVKTKLSKNGIEFKAGEKAILTSILSLGTILGSLLAPFISDRYGRKFCLVWVLTTFFFIGIILQISYPSAGLFLAGRFVNGISIGVISSVIPLFQAEISPRWIRGSIISFYQWAITWGLLVSSAICQGTRNMNDSRCFRIPIALQFVWCAILILGLSALPESPRFYVMHDDIDGAIISLSKLRRLNIDDTELVEELIEIKASHDYEVSENANSYLECFKSSPSRIHQLSRMMTGILLQTFQQCSGINFIFYYGVNFFVATGVSASYLMSFITYAVNVVFTIPGILFVDRIGRRKLLIYGCIGMIISNYIIAIVGLHTNSVIVNKVMLAFVCVFIACFAATWGPVVWVVTGELYSLSIRQKAVSLSASTNWIVNFVFAYSTPYLIDEGNHTSAALGTKIFFLWGSLNVAGLFVTIFFVYETKGLMLEEVDELYRTCSNALKSSKANKKIQELSKMNQIKRDEAEVTVSRTDNLNNNIQESYNMNSFSNSTSSNTVKGGENDFEAVSTNMNTYHTNDTTSMTPMDYLKRWEQNHMHDNILSDNIITRQSVLPFSGDEDDDDGISSGGSNSEQDDNLDFDYGLYGNNTTNVVNRQGSEYNSTGGILETNNNHQIDEEEYLRNLRAIIQDVNEQTGLNINLHGVDDETNGGYHHDNEDGHGDDNS